MEIARTKLSEQWLAHALAYDELKQLVEEVKGEAAGEFRPEDLSPAPPCTAHVHAFDHRVQVAFQRQLFSSSPKRHQPRASSRAHLKHRKRLSS